MVRVRIRAISRARPSVKVRIRARCRGLAHIMARDGIRFRKRATARVRPRLSVSNSFKAMVRISDTV
jgi:hypothetical protein